MDFEIPTTTHRDLRRDGRPREEKDHPGLFHLATAGLLPERYRIIGSSRAASAMTNDEFRSYAKEA